MRIDADLTVRQLARIVDTPASTLGAWFSGRHLPPATSTPVVRALLDALGAGERTEAWLAAMRRARGSATRRAERGVPDGAGTARERPPPYRGLAGFRPDDAELFFGRDRLTRDILGRIAALATDPGPSNGVLAVVGPSGAGKSSVLGAGVVAAVRSGRLDDAEQRWSASIVTPIRLARPVPAGDGRTLLVIDQFEEFFTALDAEQRAVVLRALTERPSGQVVVLGMRADFYADAARIRPLLAALQHAQVVIGPMSSDELRDAIRLPAAHAGAEVDDGLVDIVLADLAPHTDTRSAGQSHDAGALPLLSHALLAAWERCDGARLTIADYRATGGLDAAVQTTAENAFAGLTPSEQEVTRSAFLRLVNVEGEVITTRRRIGVAELDLLAGDAARRVMARFVDQRLVTAGDGWYEISHEALLSAWPRLHDWVDVDRAGLVTHRQLTEAANAWSDAGDDPTLLLRGARLDIGESWADTHPREVNSVETAFLAASLGARVAERRAERRRLTRLRGLLAATATLAVVAVVLALVFVQARDRADRARADDRLVRDAALSRAAAFESTELRGDDPAVAQQLAIAAFRSDRTQQARGALIDESVQPIVTRIRGQQGPCALAVSSDGRLVAFSHAIDGSVRLYTRTDAPVPTAAGVLPGLAGKPVFALAFTPDGHLLITGGAGETVHVWDVSTPTRPTLLSTLRPHVTGAIESLAISPDGRTLAVGSVGSDELTRWDLADPRSPARLPPLSGLPPGGIVQSLAYDPDGAAFAAGTSTGSAYLWTSGTTHPQVLHTGLTTVDALAFDPQRRVLFTADRLGTVEVWSAPHAGAHPLRSLHGLTSSQINVLAVSADGSLLAAGSSDADLRQWSTSDWTVQADTGNPGPVVGAAYTRDGEIVTTAADGALRLQHAGGLGLPTSGATFALVWSKNGQRLLVATNGTHGSEQLWDAADPGAVRRLGPQLTMPTPYQPIAGSGALNAAGTLVAAGNAQGRVALWDTADPSHPRLATTPFDGDGGRLVESLDFSPVRPLLAVGGDDGSVHLWNVRTPAHPRRIAAVHPGATVFNVAISADGRLLAAADSDGHGYLYDIASPTRPVLLSRMGGFRSYAYGVAFSPDGRTLAVSDADATTRLFDIARPTRPVLLGHPLVGPNDYDYSASFTPDGHTVAVASNDGTVRMYAADGSDALPEVTLRAAASNLFVAAYNPAGTLLAGGGRSDSVTLWSTDLRSYAARVCRAAGAPITRQEWHLYLPDQPYRPPCR